jgi:hypothetical protein
MASAENVIKAVSGQYKGGLEVLTIHAQDVIDVDPVSFLYAIASTYRI